MSRCPDRGEEVDKLIKSDPSGGGFLSARNVRDRPHCGAILGVSGHT